MGVGSNWVGRGVKRNPGGLQTGGGRAYMGEVDSSSSPPVARSLHRFANPGRFLRISGRVLPFVAIPALVLTLGGLAWGLLVAPADYQQGDAVRII